MPKDDNKIHLFLAETVGRKDDLIKDIKKFNQIFNCDVTNDYRLKFHCYQSAYRWEDKKFGLVIADEIQDSLSPSYYKFYENNTYDALIGLSATIDKSTEYLIGGQVITKGDMLNNIAPTCYTYSVDQGQKEGTARELKIYVIKHQLESEIKTVKAGNKKKPFLQTEKAAYEYWSKLQKAAWFIADEEDRNLRIRITSQKRSNLLYNLDSKVKVVKELLIHLHTKTILFGNSLNSLLQITPNVISSRNSDKKNNQIRANFDSDKISLIGSFKKLKQGANLNGLDNCIMMSYYSTDKDFIQRIGRLRDNGTVGHIFILVTEQTQEEIWFSKMIESVNNSRLYYFNNITECLTSLKT
jgi:superfamily II DNA or RNA helicase